MKRTFLKILTLLLTVLYTVSLLPLTAFCEGIAPVAEIPEDGVIISEGFEDEASVSDWNGGDMDAVAAFEGDFGMVVSSPFGDVDTDFFGHLLEYGDFIRLEGGKFYTFSAYLSNPMADNPATPTATAYLGENQEELFIDISSPGFDWGYVTASFMAPEDTICRLFVSVDGGDMDLGFFIDNITLCEEAKIPEYTVIDGPDTVFVPENGTRYYRYSIVAYDEDDTKVNILMDSFDFSIENMPEGVEFDEETGILAVSSNAPNLWDMTISCSASAGIPLQSSRKTVQTTKNLLSDPSFENGEELWVSDKEMSFADGVISLYADEKGEYGRYTSITYTRQLLLLAGRMYVFRAQVRSEEEFSSSSVYISNLSFAQSGYAEINITGIGGDWTEVTSAFLIEDTGLYDLTINLYAPTERPIFIDNVYLGIEDAAPTSISIRAPGNICIPADSITLPCYANVLNQLGEVMEDLAPDVTISPKTDEVYLSDGEITILHSAKAGEYTISAVYEGIEASLTVTVSDNFIGDGGFEEKEANEWWTASDGSVFSIIDYDGDLSAHVYSPDTSCLVVNNSYMELLENEYYVFSASPGFGTGIVTAFIADAYTGEYIPFAQYDPTECTKIPFSVDRTVVGRLVLYIEADESIGLIFDDIEIVPFELSAQEITVMGGEYGDYLRGSYVYVNNATDEPDSDISATRWYISSSYDGHYEPIGIPNQNYLEFTEDMAGQYIVFEVTPICAYTGVVSDSLRSLPILVAGENTDNRPDDIPLSAMVPVEPDTVKEHPFIDITGHWCEGMIASLCASGVVSGKTANRFYAEDYVTRAEFTAMIARAFSLVSLPYSGDFDDVSATDWYSGWIETCYRRGIIQGVSESEFKPNDYITREQMAVIIYRAYLICEGPMPNDLPLRYDDKHMISSWSYEAVKTGTNLNLFTGKEMNVFKPFDRATRSEAAAVIYRTLKCFY